AGRGAGVGPAARLLRGLGLGIARQRPARLSSPGARHHDPSAHEQRGDSPPERSVSHGPLPPAVSGVPSRTDDAYASLATSRTSAEVPMRSLGAGGGSAAGPGAGGADARRQGAAHGGGPPHAPTHHPPRAPPHGGPRSA